VDLVAYITQGSLIINLMDKVYELGVDHSNLLHGHAGGGTTKMPDGRVLSEVYWTGGLMAPKTSNGDRRGVALANLIPMSGLTTSTLLIPRRPATEKARERESYPLFLRRRTVTTGFVSWCVSGDQQHQREPCSHGACVRCAKQTIHLRLV